MHIIQQKISFGAVGKPVMVEFIGEDGNAISVSMNNYGKARPSDHDAVTDAKAMMVDVASCGTEKTPQATGEIPIPSTARQAPTSRGNSPID